MTQVEVSTDREKFEAWALSARLAFIAKPEGIFDYYPNSGGINLWSCWQAARATLAASAPAASEPTMTDHQSQAGKYTPRRTITMRSIRAKQLADWYEQEAIELRKSGDCDLWNLASEYEQHATHLLGHK